MANPQANRTPAPAAAAGRAAAPTLSDQEKKVARQKAKAERFKKLAARRTNKVLKAVDAIAQLANRNSYAFEPDQVTKIFTALETRVLNAKKRFESGATAAEEFSL